MNKVIIVGRLTKDVDVRKSDNDKISARFNVAVNRRFKNADGDYDADFPSCVAFGKTAEFIEKYFKKGSAIGIVGRLQTGSYEKDGTKFYTTDIVAEEVEFVESKSSNSGDDIDAPADASDDSLPFD